MTYLGLSKHLTFLGLHGSCYSPSGVARTTTSQNTLGALGLSKAYLCAPAPYSPTKENYVTPVDNRSWGMKKLLKSTLDTQVSSKYGFFFHLMRCSIYSLCLIDFFTLESYTFSTSNLLFVGVEVGSRSS